MFYTRAMCHLRQPDVQHLSSRHPDDPVLGITGHWTGEGGRLFHPDPVQRWAGIQAYHMDIRGYGDIAYNGGFDADGNLFEGRNAAWVGAHALSDANFANRRTQGIVFMEDKRGWTDAAMRAWLVIGALHRARFNNTPQEYAHEWWAQHGGTTTQCPGPYLSRVIQFLGGHA